MKSLARLVTIAALAGEGCASQSQLLDGTQAMAMQTAAARWAVRDELPIGDGDHLVERSRAAGSPGSVGRWHPAGRVDYRGVAGCGKRTTFVVICPEGDDGCFAAGPGRFMRE